MNDNDFKTHKLISGSVVEKLDNQFVITPDKLGATNFPYIGTGKDVKVCIIGTGASCHDAIKNIAYVVNMGTSKTYRDNVGNCTILGGIIGANDQNIKGLAVDAHVYYAKIHDKNETIKISNMVAAILWAIIMKVNIIAVSDCTNIDDPAMRSIIEKAHENGIIVIVDGTIENTTCPQNYQNVISTSVGFGLYSNLVQIPNNLKPIWSTFLEGKYIEVDPTLCTVAVVAGLTSIIYQHNAESDATLNTVENITKQLRASFSVHSIG